VAVVKRCDYSLRIILMTDDTKKPQEEATPGGPEGDKKGAGQGNKPGQ